MDEHLFLKGQRVITKRGEEGEVVDAIGDTITVKLDNGDEIELPSADLIDNNSAG
ncbi:preprotein translocase subunit YajC [Mucilaginibacter pallidiroseus]|uniref:Preprotein translocase subunit YajC n=1 Tax=Mucilaginibacter pallidiroseus TaxID=2599295 RepID=A0A563UC13_9SPHI|nr:preprotein translocase subunit YajC [Mucilaginibacter pallidiroseus]TWR28907.1 preprotein translocase subunit YajC [Mucilaginibacter pallidiroseus]